MDMKNVYSFLLLWNVHLKFLKDFILFFATSGCVKNSSTEKFNFEIIFLNIH